MSSGNLFYNNTAYGNALGFQVWGGTAPTAGGIVNNRYINNIAYGSAVSALQATNGGENDGTNGYGNVYAYNEFGPDASSFIRWGSSTYYSALATWQAASNQVNNLNSDPLFADAPAKQQLRPSVRLADDLASGSNLGPAYEWGLDPFLSPGKSGHTT